jgi:hypothetical protein
MPLLHHPMERYPVTHSIGGWVDPRDDLAALKKSFASDGDQMIHQMSSLQAGHSTDHTIPTHDTLHSEILLYPNS